MTFVRRFWNFVSLKGSKDCWPWRGRLIGLGYGRIRLGGRGTPLIYAHQASWIIHKGPIPKGKCVCHSCDNPPCVNPRHLFLGTSVDNALDRGRKGRTAKGMLAGKSKLTNKIVLLIRRLLDKGHKQTLLARRFGVHPSNVNRIKHRKNWKHL